MRKNYRMKRTISVKMFISELGQNLSEYIKNRLMDLEVRCVLTRKEKTYILDIKHVQHIKYPCTTENSDKVTEKEYVYGSFIVNDDDFYFCKNFISTENATMPDKIINIYDSLEAEEVSIELEEEDLIGKKIDDTNIDFIIDGILEVCPQVSQKYLDIVNEMTSHAEIKKNNTFHVTTY